jgi:hypothetical protein
VEKGSRLTGCTASEPDDLFSGRRDLGNNTHFTRILPHKAATKRRHKSTPSSVDSMAFGAFLRAIMLEWEFPMPLAKALPLATDGVAPSVAAQSHAT